MAKPVVLGSVLRYGLLHALRNRNFVIQRNDLLGTLDHPCKNALASVLIEVFAIIFDVAASLNLGVEGYNNQSTPDQPIGISPEQAQFLETRKFQINEIARIFRVPPHMLADLEKSSFSNIEQQSLEFVKYTLDPWVVRWEQSMCRVLLMESEKPKIFIKFNVDGLLRGDYVSRMSGYATRRSAMKSITCVRRSKRLRSRTSVGMNCENASPT